VFDPLSLSVLGFTRIYAIEGVSQIDQKD
jgi:hypothetical protein